MEPQRRGARASGHVVQGALVQGVRWALTLQLEHQHAAVMAGSKQIDFRVGGQDPEALVLAAEGLQGRAADMSQMRMVRSSLLLTMTSCLPLKITHDTLFMWPRRESTSHALLSAAPHSRSPAAAAWYRMHDTVTVHRTLSARSVVANSSKLPCPADAVVEHAEQAPFRSSTCCGALLADAQGGSSVQVRCTNLL